MTSSEKIDDLQKYLNDALKMSVTSLHFKDLYKFDKEILHNLNKFHEENQKIIGTIQTILNSGNIDKYCTDKPAWVPSIYTNFPNETFSRVRSFSDHPRPFTDNTLNTSKIEETTEPPTAEAKENLNNYDSIFDEEFIPKFPDLKKEAVAKQEIKKEVLQKPKKFNENFNNLDKLNEETQVKKATKYTSLIPIKSNMFLKYLDKDFIEFIKNPEDFKVIKFYYYADPKYFDGENLYIWKKPTIEYYMADNGRLYMLDPENRLVPGHHDSKMQYWKAKLI